MSTSEAETMLAGDPTLIAVNRVLADRADDFEQWLRTVVVPAVRTHHPEMENRWQVLRSAVQDDGVVPFVFLFAGGDPAEWDLQPLLEQAHGADGAARALAAMDEMLEGEQLGWPVTEVNFGHAGG
jgi:hypothetical protein